ncbi:hypothetical protein M408DRAFT_294527 [Serendipita vermifera MAFF 305830]|uniref:Uncharacterized protein n=1 Tax=Serendipita vermifera MAFF 305830 TaxID=933852 RepID=A0A0C3B074_SERVB|nr:hypothetical protein M408DRAFT_294527 [Serendipita vermifera MAFF 305830]
MSDYYSEFDSDDNRCGKCRRKDDATQRSYQNQLRPLRERMETLEIQNTRLASECARLRDELRNAKFKERSTWVLPRSSWAHY